MLLLLLDLLLCLLGLNGGWCRASRAHGITVLCDGVATCSLDVRCGDCRSDDCGVLPYRGRAEGWREGGREGREREGEGERGETDREREGEGRREKKREEGGWEK